MPDGLPCCNVDPELFFSEVPRDVDEAKSLCSQCPAKRPCLAGALERQEPWGIWGGEVLLRGAIVPTKRGPGRPGITPEMEQAAADQLLEVIAANAPEGSWQVSRPDIDAAFADRGLTAPSYALFSRALKRLVNTRRLTVRSGKSYTYYLTAPEHSDASRAASLFPFPGIELAALSI
jgi:WhiB family transcriptional regulator, redox-sensing transcriptional regulator